MNPRSKCAIKWPMINKIVNASGSNRDGHDTRSNFHVEGSESNAASRFGIFSILDRLNENNRPKLRRDNNETRKNCGRSVDVVWVCERASLNRNLVRWSENWHGRGHRRRSKLFS